MKRSQRGALLAAWLGLACPLLTAAGPPGQTRTPILPAQESPAYTIEAQVVSAAGSPGSGSGMQANGSLGQPAPVGYGGAIGYELYAGFWYARSLPTGGTDVPVFEPYLNRLVCVRPNPFNPTTEVVLNVGVEAMVTLRIHDLQGRLVRALTRETLSRGLHVVPWNGRDDSGRELPSGLYFVHFAAGDHMQTGKMLLLK